MPSLSNRAKNMQASPLRKLAVLAEERKKQGIKVYHLNIGQPDLATDKVFKETIKNLELDTIAYAPSQGLPETLAAWQKYFSDNQIDFDTEEMIVTSGGSEGIIFALSAICDPQDEVLVFEPFYTNYNGFATLAGVNLVPVTLKIENNFHLPSVEEIEEKITPKTKAILFSNPSNPTGAVYSKEELRRLVDLAKKHDLFLISDEVYREFVYQGEFYSMMNFEEDLERIILIDSVSKKFNLCGARIGILGSKNKEIRQSVLKFAMARLSVASLEQLAVIPFLNNSKKYTDELVEEFTKRRELITPKPEGAFYVIMGLPVDDSEDFCKWLIEKFNDQGETVLLAPAAGFYASPGKGKNEVRIAFMLNKKDLERSLEIINKGLKEYGKNQSV